MMSSNRYKYTKPPPSRNNLTLYSTVEQTIYDALIENDCLPSGSYAHMIDDPSGCRESKNEPFAKRYSLKELKTSFSRGDTFMVKKSRPQQNMLHKDTLKPHEELNQSISQCKVAIATNTAGKPPLAVSKNKHLELMPPPRTAQITKQKQTTYLPVHDSPQHIPSVSHLSSHGKPSPVHRLVSSTANLSDGGKCPFVAERKSAYQCKPTDYILSDHSHQSLTSPSDASQTTAHSEKSLNYKPSPLKRKMRQTKSDSSTPLATANHRKSKPNTSTTAATDVFSKHEEYLAKNRDKLVDLIAGAAVVVCITSHDRWSGQLKLNASSVGIQFSLAAMEPGTNVAQQWESFIIPLYTKSSSHSLQCFRSITLQSFGRRPLCNDAKSALSLLIDSGILLQTDIHSLNFNDVCLAQWLVNPDNFNKQALYQGDPLQRSTQSAEAQKLYNDFSSLSEKLRENEMLNVYQLELSIVNVLVVMECKGLSVDIEELDRVDKLMVSEIKALEKKAGACIGSPISLNSTVQLRQALYDRLELDKQLPKATLYKTAKGHETSTGEGVLNQLLPYHPLPKIVLDYRQIYKVHSTYISAMRGYITDSVIRTQWNQTSASTGRLQSTKPNIQAIPKTSLSFLNDVGDDVKICPRSIYKSQHGHTLLSVDFKQIELRLFAHITCDRKLQSVLRDDQQDIFCNLTAVWMNKKVGEVSEADRERTKRIVYSVMYGVGKYKLSQQLNITPMEAQSIISRFLQDFPGVQRFTSRVVTDCRQQGYAQSILGRRRVLSSINSQVFKDRTHAERQAVNFTIQGSAADICKLVMTEINKELWDNSIRASLLVQIHDELLYEVKDDYVHKAKDIFIKCMETDGGAWHGGLQLMVPLRIAVKAGKYWHDMNSF